MIELDLLSYFLLIYTTYYPRKPPIQHEFTLGRCAHFGTAVRQSPCYAWQALRGPEAGQSVARRRAECADLARDEDSRCRDAHAWAPCEF